MPQLSAQYTALHTLPWGPRKYLYLAARAIFRRVNSSPFSSGPTLCSVFSFSTGLASLRAPPDLCPGPLVALSSFSVLTSISLDNHNWIPTTDNRLLRRIIRDYRFRGYSARDTIARWRSVRRGEDKWIFPYQENADAMFNSAMIYELAAIKKFAEPILAEVRECEPENAEAYRLMRFLRYFNSIPETGLPGTSLLREFLGGGTFKY